MSIYLHDLISSVKRDLDQERARVRNAVFHQRATEQREVGPLRRLEQRLQVLEQLKTTEAARNRRRRVVRAQVSRAEGHRSARQPRREERSAG
jgi:hypothetical protein